MQMGRSNFRKVECQFSRNKSEVEIFPKMALAFCTEYPSDVTRRLRVPYDSVSTSAPLSGACYECGARRAMFK